MFKNSFVKAVSLLQYNFVKFLKIIMAGSFEIMPFGLNHNKNAASKECENCVQPPLLT